MVRSTAISWKIGLAVSALALQLAPLPALADDGLAETVEKRPQPLEPKAVRVTVLQPASDAAVAGWRPWQMGGAPIIMVRPADNAAIAQPHPDEVEAAPVWDTIVPPSPEQVEGTPSIMARAAGNAAVTQPRPEQFEAAPILMQPVENAAVVRPRLVPEKIQEDVARVEPRPLSEGRPRVAVAPPASNAAVAPPRLEPAKTENAAPLVAIPSLPGRSPFRQAPFKSEIVENGPNAPAALRQQSPETAPAKGNAASRFFANLWPGNKGASTPASSTAQGSSSSAGAARAGSLGPSASNSAPPAQGQAETGAKSDKPPIKRLLDGIQFWKN